jgi:hypothetical protein
LPPANSSPREVILNGGWPWRRRGQQTSVTNIRRHPARQVGRLLLYTNLSGKHGIQLQRQPKGLVKGSVDFRSEVEDFSTIRSHFESSNFSHVTYPKSQKPVKCVIRHLPISAPAEDMRRSRAEGTTTVNIPLFLITLLRTSKSHEKFKLTSLLPYCNQGRGVQSSDWSHAVLQLPEIRPCLG